jgi:hypothetical protein
MSRLEADVDVTAQEYVHIRGFCDLGKALGAGRALQLAFEGSAGIVVYAFLATTGSAGNIEVGGLKMSW